MQFMEVFIDLLGLLQLVGSSLRAAEVTEVWIDTKILHHIFCFLYFYLYMIYFPLLFNFRMDQ